MLCEKNQNAAKAIFSSQFLYINCKIISLSSPVVLHGRTMGVLIRPAERARVGQGFHDFLDRDDPVPYTIRYLLCYMLLTVASALRMRFLYASCVSVIMVDCISG